MIVNPDVDGYRLIHRKTFQKTTENQKNTKTELQAKWDPEF